QGGPDAPGYALWWRGIPRPFQLTDPRRRPTGSPGDRRRPRRDTEDDTMEGHSRADTVPIRVTDARLLRLDLEAAAGRLVFDPDSAARRCWDIQHAAARRALLRDLQAGDRPA